MAVPLDRTFLTVALLVLASLTTGCDGSGGEGTLSADAGPPVDDFPESVIAALPEGATIETLREGREQYAVCSVCHGADAEGTQLGPAFRGAQWAHSDGTVEGIEAVIRTGVAQPANYPSPMPPMGGGAFDDEEIRALATYIYALGIGG